MKPTNLLRFVMLILLSLLIAACSTEAQDEQQDEADHAGSSMPGMMHAHVDPPDEFASLTNPFSGNDEAIEAGEVIFQTNCATCHGPEGKGDGPAAEGLDPRPATLADGTMMHSLSDGYLFWRVSKGGQMEPFNSAMPAWEAALTEEQRWQVISFVRSLADDSGEHMDEHMDEGEHMDDHMNDSGRSD